MAVEVATPRGTGHTQAATLWKLVDEGLRRALDGIPAPLRGLCGEALGVTDVEGRPCPSRGKRVRPVLCLMAAEACGGSASAALPAALAVECVHAFSLVHDDIVDGDRERRGRPSLWATVGTRLALNAGDALHALASIIAAPAGPWAASLIESATLAMIEGQHLDLSAEATPHPSLAAWTELARRKTGALFAASLAAGAAVADCDDALVERCWTLGELLGLYFQAQDDILGVWGDPAITGKPVGHDLTRRTLGLPVACAAEGDGDEAIAWRAAFADWATPPATLLALLESCGARARAERVENGYAADLVRLAASPPVPPDLSAVITATLSELRGRRS